MNYKIKSAIVTSLLSGALVFFGAFSTGYIDLTSIVAAISAAAIVAITKFRDFWNSQPEDERRELFTFI